MQDWLNGHQWWLISGAAYSEICVEIDIKIYREIEVKIYIEMEDLCAAHLFISRTWISNYISHDIVVCVYLSMSQIPACFTQIRNPFHYSQSTWYRWLRVHENHRTHPTFPMARPKCLMRDFTNLTRIYKAHRTNVWWTMKVFSYTVA